jgi:Mg2+ and Co2+ transporter CorA
VAELFREIQAEIRSSHEYLVIEAGQEQTEMSTRLTVVATIGLFLALVTGALGMNILIEKYVGEETSYSKHWEIVAIVFVLFSFFMCGVVAKAKLIATFFDKLVDSTSSTHADADDYGPGPKRGV